MAKMYGKGKTAIESEELQKRRWQIELEFVQCLSNPNYLNCKNNITSIGLSLINHLPQKYDPEPARTNLPH
ncbi:uncharacterized protein Dyak_GE14983, partial [Drosophila yakuba]